MSETTKPGPEGVGSKHMPSVDGTDEVDVAGHGRDKVKDAAPDGAGSKHLPTFDGSDEDDVEGHGKNLPL